jgi:2-keto-4-pentenoate hydratase
MSGLCSTVVADLADRLWRAESERVAVPPLTAELPEMTLDDAYAVQTRNIDRRVAAGAVIRGRKAGLTSRPVQDLLGVHEPNFGVLLDDMFVEEGDEVRVDTLLQPRVESEIAFLMGSDLAGPGVTATDALAAVAGVLPAVEVVDSRIVDWRVRIADTVADNAASARVVVGARMVPVTAVDLRLLGVLFFRNGSPIESGAGAEVLGDPALCVAWLANKLGSFGSGLRSGDVVLSGALHRMVPVRPGDRFQAMFAHLGSVTVQFSGGIRE